MWLNAAGIDRAQKRVMSRSPFSRGAAPVPLRLWATFALAWLVVLCTTIVLVAREALTPVRLGLTVADLALLAALYVWLTLRVAPLQESAAGAADILPLRARFVALAGIAGLVVPLVVLVPTAGMWWHVMYAVIAAGLALPAVMAAAAIVALVVGAVTVAALIAGHIDPRLFIQLAIGGAAMAVRRLALTVEELRVARETLAQRAVDAERLRIARDLHDLLGHSLSLICIKGELAGRLLPDSPHVAAREVREIERAARDALRQVRSAVIGYRQPTVRGELAAARELLAAAGMRVSVVDDGGELPADVDCLVAWTIREGVTNVIRHSRATTCEIRVSRTVDDRARVVISDDGIGGDALPTRVGSGLMGLRERAASASACLTAGPTDSGFSVALDAAIHDSDDVPMEAER